MQRRVVVRSARLLFQHRVGVGLLLRLRCLVTAPARPKGRAGARRVAIGCAQRLLRLRRLITAPAQPEGYTGGGRRRTAPAREITSIVSWGAARRAGGGRRVASGSKGVPHAWSVIRRAM